MVQYCGVVFQVTCLVFFTGLCVFQVQRQCVSRQHDHRRHVSRFLRSTGSGCRGPASSPSANGTLPFKIVVTYSDIALPISCVFQPVVSEAAQPVAAEPVRVARVDLSAMKVEEMDVIEDAPAVRPTSLRFVG